MGKMLRATSLRCNVLQRAMIHRWGVRLPPAAWLRLRSLGHLGQAEYKNTRYYIYIISPIYGEITYLPTYRIILAVFLLNVFGFW